MTPRELFMEFRRTLDIAACSVESLRRLGQTGFDCTPKALETMERWGKGFRSSETLEDIRNDLGECRRCGLSASRNHIVFGVGDPEARLVFVGEGPGHEEDRQGKPFVGAAGQLLNKIIEAMGLTREKVYICNVVKCRPPGNRVPLPDEIDSCSPFLTRQLLSIRPEVICTLGSVASRMLLGVETPISRLRGRFYDFRGIRVMPTYHPAYLLRNPEKKRAVWEDMQQVMPMIRRGENGA